MYNFFYLFIAMSCNFEKSMCDWKNHRFSVLKGPFTKFLRISSKKISTLYGRKDDLDFPNSDNGHYMALYNDSDVQCRYTYHYAARKDAMVYASSISKTHNLCYFILYAYKKSATFINQEAITVYADLNDQLLFLEKLKLETTWQSYKISIKHLKGKRFSIVLVGSIKSHCQSYIGIDHTNYESCSIERLASELKITDTKFENCRGKCLNIQNRDERHNKIQLERLSFLDQHKTTKPEVISIDLQSAYILARNLYIPKLDYCTFFNVKFGSASQSRVSVLVFTQNYIGQLHESKSFNLINSGENNATVYFHRSFIENSLSNSPLIELQNVETIFTDNFIYNNTISNILSVNSNSLKTNISFNIFIFNKEHIDSQGNVIDSKSKNLYINNNILHNPQVPYEISYPIKNKEFLDGNYEYNWWGTVDSGKIKKRIRDGRILFGSPTLSFIPLLQEEPEDIAISESCRLGWKFISDSCYYFHVGAGTKTEADLWCRRNTAFLITDYSVNTKKKLKNLLEYTDVDGEKKISHIWTSDQAQLTGVLKPWICQKSSSGFCPSNCNRRGSCSGTMCICDAGWTGNDCSKISCEDVANCSYHGECVGPNICKCDPGWYGSHCGASKCPRYSSCQQCTKDEGCGWCDTTQKCVPGNAEKSFSSCENYFFRNCLTFSPSTCSKEIHQIQCSEQLCNMTRTGSVGFCQQCRDLETCYSKVSPVKCASLNESICPLGVVSPNLEDPERKNFMEVHENIIKVPKSRRIYRCVRQQNLKGNSEGLFEVLVIPGLDRFFSTGNILLSPQSNGIMHKVYNFKRSPAKYTIAIAKYADPLEVLKYAHVKIQGTFDSTENPRAIDLVPSAEQMENYLQSQQSYREVGNITYKCTGQEYKYKKENMWSYFVLAKSNELEIENVLFSSSPKGYLEKIVHSRRAQNDLFIETELFDCSSELQGTENLDNIENLSSELECPGGDGTTGLFYMDRRDYDKPIAKNALISGRTALPALGIVINKASLLNGWIAYEVINVASVSQRMNASEFEIDELTRKTRRKRASFSGKVTATASQPFSQQMSVS